MLLLKSFLFIFYVFKVETLAASVCQKYMFLSFAEKDINYQITNGRLFKQSSKAVVVL